jgi:hypothetical protein
MGAAFPEASCMNLWERPASATFIFSEFGQVLVRIRDVDLDTVDRHQPPGPQPCVPRTRFRQRDRDSLKQYPRRQLTQSLPSLGYGTCCGTVQVSLQLRKNRSPFTSLRSTSS